jgi:hypothetical protein
LTPASRKQYEIYLKRLRDAKEIEIWRNDKLFTGDKSLLQKKDIIKLPSKYQFTLFYQSKLFGK